jgi:hypothetical protein
MRRNQYFFHYLAYLSMNTGNKYEQSIQETLTY